MRVVHIIKAKGIAGAERHVLYLLEGLRERDVDARLIILAQPDNSADTMEQAAQDLGIPTQREIIRRHFSPGLFGRLRSALQTLKPHIVHTHLLHADLYGIPAARFSGVPAIVSTRHNDDPRRRGFSLRWINAGLWRMADAGIAVSNSVRQFSIGVERVPPRKIRTIYHGMKPAEKHDKGKAHQALCDTLQIPDSSCIAGMVCRLMDAKGLPEAIDAIALLKNVPELHLVIVGDGPLRHSLEHQIARHNLQKRVHLTGWRDNVTKIIAGFDMLLMPSTREGFGVTLLEAMSQAVPIIGSTAGAVPEVVIHGETGLTVPPHDAQALAEAMRVLIEDKPLRMHLGLVGQDRLDTHFSLTNMVDETLALYRTLYRE